MDKKAQVAIEFIIVIGAALFFFSLIFLTIQEKNTSNIHQRRMMIIRDIGVDIQNEINLAHESSDGYSRTFTIPPTMDGRAYTAKLNFTYVELRTNDGDYSATVPIPPVNITDPVNLILLTEGSLGNLIKKEFGNITVTPL